MIYFGTNYDWDIVNWPEKTQLFSLIVKLKYKGL